MFFQSFLGKYYKYLYILIHSFKSATAYRWSTLSWLFSRLLTIGATVLIWKLNIESGSAIIKFNEIFTYYIVGGILSINNGVSYNLSGSIKSGSLTTKQLRPTSIWLQCILNDFGWNGFTILLEMSILFLIGLIGREFMILPSFDILIFGILAFLIGIILRIFINLIAGMCAFFMTDAWGVIDLFAQLNWHLSGKSIPLNIISTLLVQTPFAFLYFVPMQIYLNKYNFEQIIIAIFGGIIWCLVLFVIARIIFKIGLKKNEAVGL
jgi:ABC-2 type transport system permease protein